MPYDYSVDMWSIGCTLYELYTGKILFTGDSNNQMLKAIMEVRGRITQKLFKRGQLSPQHFDEKGQFISVEHDKVLGKVCMISFLVNPQFSHSMNPHICHLPHRTVVCPHPRRCCIQMALLASAPDWRAQWSLCRHLLMHLASIMR